MGQLVSISYLSTCPTAAQQCMGAVLTVQCWLLTAVNVATRTLPKSGTWASIKGLSGTLHPPDPSWISRSLLEHIPGSREYLVICAAPYMLQSQPLPVHRELSAPARRSTGCLKLLPRALTCLLLISHLPPAHFTWWYLIFVLKEPMNRYSLLTSSVLSKGFTGSHH